MRAAQVKQVHGHRQRQVAVGIEALNKLGPLIAQVGADGEPLLKFDGHIPRLDPVRLELLRHGLPREIGDVPDHARQRQPDVGAMWMVIILAAVEVRVAQDRVAAHHIEGQRLAGQPGRGRQGDDAPHGVRMTDRPGDCLVSAQ